MKKFFLNLFIIIIAAAVGFGGYWWYKTWSAFNIDFPSKADRVVRINFEKIGQKLITESADKEQPKMVELIRNSFEIPFNVLAFGVKSVSPNVFYTKLEIADYKQFETLLNQNFPLGKDSLRHNKSGFVSLLFNKENVIFIWGNDTNAAVFNLANDYLNEKNLSPLSKSPLYEIKKRKSDIASLGNMYNFDINFEKGAIVGTFTSRIQQERKFSGVIPKDVALGFYLNDNIINFLDRLGVHKISEQISNDDLKNLFDNGFALCINGEVMQKRKISSYEFNDNFEKVQVELDDTIGVPYFNLETSLVKNKGSLDKLKAASIVQSGFLNPAIFPLFKVKALDNDNAMFLKTEFLDSTLPQISTSEEQIIGKSSDLLLFADFKKLSKIQMFFPFKKYLEPLDRLDIKNQSEQLYSINLSFKDKKEFSLKQLMKMLQ